MRDRVQTTLTNWGKVIAIKATTFKKATYLVKGRSLARGIKMPPDYVHVVCTRPLSRI